MNESEKDRIVAAAVDYEEWAKKHDFILSPEGYALVDAVQSAKPKIQTGYLCAEKGRILRSPVDGRYIKAIELDPCRVRLGPTGGVDKHKLHKVIAEFLREGGNYVPEGRVGILRMAIEELIAEGEVDCGL